MSMDRKTLRAYGDATIEIMKTVTIQRYGKSYAWRKYHPGPPPITVGRLRRATENTVTLTVEPVEDPS